MVVLLLVVVERDRANELLERGRRSAREQLPQRNSTPPGARGFILTPQPTNARLSRGADRPQGVHAFARVSRSSKSCLPLANAESEDRWFIAFSIT